MRKNKAGKSQTVLAGHLASQSSVFALTEELSAACSKGLEFNLSFDARFEALQDCEKIASKIKTIQKPYTFSGLNLGRDVEEGMNNVRILEFENWLETNGVDLSKIEIKQTEDSKGNGVFCKQELKEQELAFSIPRKLVLSYSTSSHVPMLSQVFRDTPMSQQTRLVLLLLSELFLANASTYKAYLDVLPSYLSSLPLNWPLKDLRLFKGTSCEANALRRNLNVYKEYCDLFKVMYTRMQDRKLHDKSVAQMPLLLRKFQKFTLENFIWGCGIAMTRQNSIPYPSPRSPDGIALELCLLPLFDMCNHENGFISSNCVVESKDFSKFSMQSTAQRDFSQGEEFKIFYGDRSSSNLLVYCGFVQKDNISDSVEISLLDFLDQDNNLVKLKMNMFKRLYQPCKAFSLTVRKKYNNLNDLTKNRMLLKVFWNIKKQDKSGVAELLKQSFKTESDSEFAEYVAGLDEDTNRVFDENYDFEENLSDEKEDSNLVDFFLSIVKLKLKQTESKLSSLTEENEYSKQHLSLVKQMLREEIDTLGRNIPPIEFFTRPEKK